MGAAWRVEEEGDQRILVLIDQQPDGAGGVRVNKITRIPFDVQVAKQVASQLSGLVVTRQMPAGGHAAKGRRHRRLGSCRVTGHIGIGNDPTPFGEARAGWMRTSKSRSEVVILLATVLALTLGGSSGASITEKVIAQGKLLKGHLIAVAEVIAKTPTTLSVKIVATPAQQVKVDWSLVCSKGTLALPAETEAPGVQASPGGSGPEEKSGIFSATTPLSRPLGLPLAHPKVCMVTVYGTLSKDGTELIQILQS